MALFNKRNSGIYKNLSAAELGYFTREGRLREWLRYLAIYDVETMFHRFNDVSVANLGWAVANSGGAGAADLALPSTKVLNGGATAAPGTTDNGSLSAIHYLQWNGDQNVGIMGRLKIDSITGGHNTEFGLIDAVPGSNGPGCADVDTPTATMTDGAVFTIDGDQTITTLAAVTAGTSFTTTATTLAAPSPTAYVAATYLTFMIQLIGNAAYFYCNGVLCASHTGDKVEGGTLLAPWIYVRNRSTGAKIATIDFVAAWQDRA